MKEKFISKSIDFINKYEPCDDLKLIKLKYGLEGIYNLVLKMIVVIFIAIITHTLKETALVILFYGGIRTFSYGIHAKSSLACWITTPILYNLIPILIKNITMPKYIGYTCLIISAISMLFFAPADTPKKPLIRKKHRLTCKIISIFIVFLYTMIYLYSKNTIIKDTLIYALMVQTICINPLLYKATNTRFNNYKYYHKKS